MSCQLLFPRSHNLRATQKGYQKGEKKIPHKTKIITIKTKAQVIEKYLRTA
jgi:hypothetical protein